MPKIGMEPIRRASLVEATIEEIGRAHSLDVTVGQIARTAGMSTALAHHYFGGKDQIFVAAMRHILQEYAGKLREALAGAASPYDRARGIIRVNFDDTSFTPGTVSAWMTLYASAWAQPDTHQLLRIYQRRLRSNLRFALRSLSAKPEKDAETLAALIDGLYLRAALSERGDSLAAMQLALDTLDLLLGKSSDQT